MDRRVALFGVLVFIAGAFGHAAVLPPLVGKVSHGQRVRSCQLFRDNYVYLQWSGPEASPVTVAPGGVGPFARVTAYYGSGRRTDQFIPDGYTGSGAFPAANRDGWPSRFVCTDNAAGDLPALVPCPHQRISTIDGGPDITFDGLAVTGSTITASWDAFVNNFFPSGRATFQNDAYYFQIDGSKPRVLHLTGGATRNIVQHFAGVDSGMHEITYGVGSPVDDMAWNVCV